MQIPAVSLERLISFAVLTAIILVNLKLAKSAGSHPAIAVWRDHPRLMWASMTFVFLMLVFTALDLAVQFGMLGADTLAAAMPLIGVPAVLAALWMIVECGRLGYAFLAGRR